MTSFTYDITYVLETLAIDIILHTQCIQCEVLLEVLEVIDCLLARSARNLYIPVLVVIDL